MSARGRWLTAAMMTLALGCSGGISAAQNASPAQSFELPPLEYLRATRERPLFNPTRRPLQIVAEPEAPPLIVESVALPFELTGIALGDDVRLAILHNKTTNDEVRLREGDKIEDWTIEAVADRFIVLRGDGRRVRLWLFDNGKDSAVRVQRVDGVEESAAATVPDAQVDQEVLPNEAPAARPPAVISPLKGLPRPPAAARAAPIGGPGAKRGSGSIN